MLYTTYFANMHKLPSNKNITKIIITRFVPKWFNNNKFDDIIIRKRASAAKRFIVKIQKIITGANSKNNFCSKYIVIR